MHVSESFDTFDLLYIYHSIIMYHIDTMKIPKYSIKLLISYISNYQYDSQ